MDNLKALGRGTQMMFISAVLLIIISFFRWQEASVGPYSVGRNALHGFWGWVMFLLTIVLVARIAARLAAVDVPIPLSFATTSFVLGILIAVCAVLKVLTDDYTKFWAYIGVLLAILIAVGAWLEVKEAGGMEHLRSEATALGGAAGGAAAAARGGAGGEAAAPAPEAPAPPAAESPAPAAPAPAPPAPEAPPAASAATDAPSGAPAGAGEAGSAPDAASRTAGEAASGAAGTAESAMGQAGDAASETADDLTGGPSTGGGT